MSGMSEVRWRLADYLAEHGLSAYALGKATGITRMNTIYRIARRGNEPTRVDLPTLALVLDGLTRLTGKRVSLLDVLEYIPDPSLTASPTEEELAALPEDTERSDDDEDLVF